jgi:hypothetical protein
MRRGADGKVRWLSVADVARRCAAHRSTIWAWVKTGLTPAGGGERVKLRVERVGRFFKTRPRWLRLWQQQVNGGAAPERPTAARVARGALADRAALARRLGG